tara:strand:+ start:49 stop:450 length:402 start_codon:yes stop_codon:yes gene_type:complete
LDKKSQAQMGEKNQNQDTINKIFKLNKKIRFVAIILDNGEIVKSEMKSSIHSLLTKSTEKKFCKDVSERKKMRQEFNKSLGKVRYVNVERENISQIVVYVNSKSVFVTVEPEITTSGKSLLISKIKKLISNLK